MKKILLLLSLLPINPSCSYDMPSIEYRQLHDNQTLCVKTIREKEATKLLSTMRVRFNDDISDAIFFTECEDPVTKQKYDILRSSLMNPFYIDFNENIGPGIMSLMHFHYLWLNTEDKKIKECAIRKKDSQGNTLIEFIEDLEKKLKDKIDIESQKASSKYNIRNLELVLGYYDDRKNTLNYCLERIKNPIIPGTYTPLQDPEAECPQWNQTPPYVRPW